MQPRYRAVHCIFISFIWGNRQNDRAMSRSFFEELAATDPGINLKAADLIVQNLERFW
jgi:hypothetical protein